jgi:hypothetical protein
MWNSLPEFVDLYTEYTDSAPGIIYKTEMKTGLTGRAKRRAKRRARQQSGEQRIRGLQMKSG